MIIENLFPIPIGFFKYDQMLSDESLRYISELKESKNLGNTRSEETHILRNKCLSSLKQYIEKSLHEYFITTYQPKYDVRMKITQSWLNWNKPGEWHHLHSHPNSFISGCFYVNADKKTDKIFFHKEKCDLIKIEPIEWNIYNSDKWWFPIETGNLILFPSYLKHSVEPVVGIETRISIAFNTFPLGNVGNELSLSGLHLLELE